MREVDRRTFLGLGMALGAAAVALPAGGRSRSAFGSTGSDGLGGLSELFPSTRAMERIGERAVRRRLVGRDAAEIALALAPQGSDRDRWLAEVSTGELRRELGAAVAADFAAERIVDVAGWQLSLTEARIAALFFLKR